MIDPQLGNHYGEIVKLTGDGMLVTSDSVVDAVGPAASIHKAIASAEAAVPADRRIAFRIDRAIMASVPVNSAPKAATIHAALALTHCFAGKPVSVLVRIRKAIRRSTHMPD